MSHPGRDLLGHAGQAGAAIDGIAVPRRTAAATRATAAIRSAVLAGHRLRIVAGGSAPVSLLGRVERVDASDRIAWFGEDR